MLVIPVHVRVKFVADRFSEVLTQQALTDFIASGQFERHLRRTSARNAGRRRALVQALRQHFGARIEVAGRDAGVQLLVWLNDVAPDQLAGLIERARKVGVGLYSLAQYYAQPPNRAGLLFGYAALTEAEIRAGIRRLRSVM